MTIDGYELEICNNDRLNCSIAQSHFILTLHQNTEIENS